jgi:anti-sigma regulatory factor (Ser/Thr protein kinase)
MLNLKIKSDPAALKTVRQKVEDYLAGVGMDEQQSTRVVLAMDEALTNIIRHAYGNETGQPIEIDMKTERASVIITLRDYGRVVDRSKIRSRALQDVRPGGLGVHIIHDCMDDVNYEPAEGGGTRLTMKKTITT